ncbi:MAG: restriction endonuclease [Desulfobacteraceae bacterium]|nr:MAG: restriction endonuclease [Desulfobacteraceae bacterium]
MEKTIPASEAFERLKANPLNHLPLALVYRIEVEEASFGYYARAATDRQRYLQPVYIFSGLAHAKLPDIKTRNMEVNAQSEVLKRCSMNIINQVIGAAKRADVDHAFLVTTSFYTKDVSRRKAEFSDIRLHLRDGYEVQEWLKNYEPKSDGGLWLSNGWDFIA